MLRVVRFAHKFNPARAKDSTFVWHLADNCCRGLLSHYQTQQYSACETLSIEPEMEERLSIPSQLELSSSFNVVEKVIEMGSDAVCDLLDQIFSKGVQERPSRAAVEELRSLAQRCGATLEDFRRVYAWVG